MSIKVFVSNSEKDGVKYPESDILFVKEEEIEREYLVDGYLILRPVADEVVTGDNFSFYYEEERSFLTKEDLESAFLLWQYGMPDWLISKEASEFNSIQEAILDAPNQVVSKSELELLCKEMYEKSIDIDNELIYEDVVYRKDTRIVLDSSDTENPDVVEDKYYDFLNEEPIYTERRNEEIVSLYINKLDDKLYLLRDSLYSNVLYSVLEDLSGEFSVSDIEDTPPSIIVFNALKRGDY